MRQTCPLPGFGRWVAFGLVVVFWLTYVFFKALGTAGVLPPVVAAWAPHALFLALAGYITLGLRT